MINAAEMRKTANQYHEDVRKAAEETVKAFCDIEVAAKIDEEARKGEYAATIEVPKGVNILMVMDYLGNNGYAVKRNNGTLKVEW